jgi:hypothetical protein
MNKIGKSSGLPEFKEISKKETLDMEREVLRG